MLKKNEVRANVLRILRTLFGSPCSHRRGRKKRARRRSSGVLVLLYALREHSRAARRATESRVLSRNLIGGEEKRKKERRVELGEDVKCGEEEKWIVTKESTRSGLIKEIKKETKLKQNKSTVLCSLSLTSVLRRGDYYIIPYICIIYIT